MEVSELCKKSFNGLFQRIVNIKQTRGKAACYGPLFYFGEPSMVENPKSEESFNAFFIRREIDLKAD